MSWWFALAFALGKVRQCGSLDRPHAAQQARNGTDSLPAPSGCADQQFANFTSCRYVYVWLDQQNVFIPVALCELFESSRPSVTTVAHLSDSHDGNPVTFWIAFRHEKSRPKAASRGGVVEQSSHASDATSQRCRIDDRNGRYPRRRSRLKCCGPGFHPTSAPQDTSRGTGSSPRFDP
jgi:hypothetical protein